MAKWINGVHHITIIARRRPAKNTIDMHTKNVLLKGKKLEDAGKAIIMIHGRGANSEDITSLAAYLHLGDFAIVAPEATNNTWYPYSFLAPKQANEPWLSSALELLGDVVGDVTTAGIKTENIYFLGFSQGACLTLEFTARNAKRYGGIVAFTGGLIGEQIDTKNYSGDFAGTPVFIGTSDPDPHIPVQRMTDSAAIFKNMNAVVTDKVYPDMGHTINQDELNTVNKIIFSN